MSIFAEYKDLIKSWVDAFVIVELKEGSGQLGCRSLGGNSLGLQRLPQINPGGPNLPPSIDFCVEEVRCREVYVYIQSSGLLGSRYCYFSIFLSYRVFSLVALNFNCVGVSLFSFYCAHGQDQIA